jgi:hypothetical protein
VKSAEVVAVRAVAKNLRAQAENESWGTRDAVGAWLNVLADRLDAATDFEMQSLRIACLKLVADWRLNLENGNTIEDEARWQCAAELEGVLSNPYVLDTV